MSTCPSALRAALNVVLWGARVGSDQGPHLLDRAVAEKDQEHDEGNSPTARRRANDTPASTAVKAIWW